jgi:hypothetical protein
MNVKLITPGIARRTPQLALVTGFLLAANGPLAAQAASPDSTAKVSAATIDSSRTGRYRFYRRMTAGFAASILLHESAHFVSAYSMGFHPHFGFDKWRPTVFSGIDESTDRRKQFIFSAAGLTAQELLDELVLDVPHSRGGAFERGILAAGIGTTLFYVSLGRNAHVSDISVMARNSSLSKTQVSLIFGSVAALHTVRIGRDHHYAHFFVRPSTRGGMSTGVSFRTW